VTAAKYLVVCVVTASVLSGCGGIAVRTDFDRYTAFTEYRTYRWLPQATDREGNSLLANELIWSRLKQTVDRQMSLKGFRDIGTDTADLTLAAYLTDEEDQEIVEAGYRTFTHESQFKHLKPGTLVLDVVDTRLDRLVWRGVAAGVDTDPDRIEQSIQTAAEKILYEFPPRDYEGDMAPPNDMEAEEY
jgi:hypothetical protein